MPETLGIQMLATLEQAEEFYKGKSSSSARNSAKVDPEGASEVTQQDDKLTDSKL